MTRWRQLGENTVCSDKDDSGDVFSGKENSMANPDDCPKLCLTKTNCAFATYWGTEYKYCYLFSADACSNPKDDTKYKGISWQRQAANITTATTTAATTTTTTAPATTTTTTAPATTTTTTTTTAAPGTTTTACRDQALTGQWRGYKCSLGVDYCKYDAFKEKCCMCGGGSARTTPQATATTAGATTTCQDLALPGAWGAGAKCSGFNKDYCVHKDIKEQCCMCGGGKQQACQ